RREATSLVEPLGAIVSALDPDLPMFRVRSMKQISTNAVAQPRLYAVLIASFAGTALLLGIIGFYGLLAYAVGQRTREIGLRLALGASRAEVLRMVLRQAGRLTSAGVAGGLAGAALGRRVVQGQLVW